MKTILLRNWKAKIASLLLSFAIWYLIDSNLSPDQHSIREKDPGVNPSGPDPNNPAPAPVPATPPVPAAKEKSENGLGYLAPASVPVAIMMVQSRVYRLHWVEFGDFSGSLRQFPGYQVG